MALGARVRECGLSSFGAIEGRRATTPGDCECEQKSRGIGSSGGALERREGLDRVYGLHVQGSFTCTTQGADGARQRLVAAFSVQREKAIVPVLLSLPSEWPGK
jgi:hypothetical protein